MVRSVYVRGGYISKHIWFSMLLMLIFTAWGNPRCHRQWLMIVSKFRVELCKKMLKLCKLSANRTELNLTGAAAGGWCILEQRIESESRASVLSVLCTCSCSCFFSVDLWTTSVVDLWEERSIKKIDWAKWYCMSTTWFCSDTDPKTRFEDDFKAAFLRKHY